MRKIIPFTILITVLTGCRQYAFYQSPLHANTNSYKAIPLQKENIPVANYASLNFMAGGVNDTWHDDTYSFTGAFHRSHNFSILQAYYGGNIVLGNYRVRSYDPVDPLSNYNSRAFNDSAINTYAGNKFFGAWGVAGGINAVVPLGRRGGEWRVLGTELSFNSEFGEYLHFRRKLPAGAANIVDRKSAYCTVGFFTELIARFRDGNSLGYKWALVTSTRKLRDDQYAVYYDPYLGFLPIYFSQTYHLTLRNTTLYVQWNMGSYAANLQTGFNIRLRKTKQAGKTTSL